MTLYLDHNACSPLREDIRACLRAHLDSPLLNPGSVHQDGQRAKGVLEQARRRVAEAIGRRDGRVVFTSGATEANNQALFGVAASRPGALVTSPLEHPSTVAAAQAWATQHDRPVWWLPNDATGRWDHAALEAQLRSSPPRLVALMLANNELGTRNDIENVAAMCLRYGVPLHVDAAQVLGRFAWHPPEGVTSVTASAHKAGGPIGVGMLWTAEGAPRPIVHGGHQERGARGGTEDAARADALSRVLAAPDPRWAALAPVRDAFETRIRERTDATVHGHEGPRLPNTSNVWLGCDAEEALIALDLAGVRASAGSACTAGSIDPSPVLLALGVGEQRARQSLRFSLGPEHAEQNGAALAERVLEALAPLGIG